MRRRAVVEELFFGLDVPVEVAVVIEVVMRDVRKDCPRKVGPCDAVLHNGMRARLHENVGASGVGHLAKQGLQAEGIRRGVGRGNHAVHNAVLDRAEHAGLAVQQPVQLVQEGDCGRFAVGSCDGHHFHVAGGVVVERGRHVPKGVGAGLDLDHRHMLRGFLGHALTNHARRARRNGLVDEIVPVHDGAWDGDKEAQGLNLARVNRDVFDSHMGGASHLEDARVVKQVGEQFHERRS